VISDYLVNLSLGVVSSLL
jgi:hypothetical protein